MKVGTLTYHDTRNYGAVLQAFALQKTIEKLGVDCEIIDYKSDFITQSYKIKKINEIKSIKEFIKWICTIRYDKSSSIKFNEFNEKHQKISKLKYNKSTIKNSNSVYDKFVVGSDQVWNLNLNGIDTTYLLDFAENSKKNSYAASFGYKTIPEKYIDMTKQYLSSINCISVRENQGKDIIEKCINKSAQVVLDPTLLLNKDEWSKISSKSCSNKREYILLYSVAATPTLFEFAKKLAKEKNCDIVYINRSYFNKLGMINVRDASPQEFLGYIEGAKYVVTSSFHGVVFALNYEKNFFYELDIKPENNNSRLESIIDMVGLKNREIIDCKNEYIDENIDYSKINEIIKKERKNSIDFIKKILK